MLFIYVFITFIILSVEGYSNNLFNLVDLDRNNGSAGCGSYASYAKPEAYFKLPFANTTQSQKDDRKILEAFSISTFSPYIDEPDPFIDLQVTLNKILFGEYIESDDNRKVPDPTEDPLALYPSGQMMRAEIFQEKRMVHLPRSEFLHPDHMYLNTSSPDFMQTAVNAFSILLEGSLKDIYNLPSNYILRSARAISMMKIAREKLVATWKVVKGNHKTQEITYPTLEYYRPLFKYVNGREMSRLNLSNDRILSFLGSHSDLDRHQVGVIASQYIKTNKYWDSAKYLNLMNNLLCGVPMKFMRRVSENVYLQLSHQIFYHIKACDPLQRRFFLAMMTRTQVLGKSNSWGARDVARLGLLLTEVEGQELSAINPEAMVGITPQVMLEMPASKLKFLTETQIRYLAQKPMNILTKKIRAYDDETTMFNYAKISLLTNIVIYVVIALKVIA